MGLFGFGKKKREREEAEAKAENREDEAAVDTEGDAAPDRRGGHVRRPRRIYGPWDVDDENVPDYDEYLDMGSYYLPYLAGLQLRIKRTAAPRRSSARPSATARPAWRSRRSRRKTMGLWDDVRADCLRPTRRHPNTRACSAPNSTCRSPSRAARL